MKNNQKIKNKIINNTLHCGLSNTVSIVANLLLLPLMITKIGIVEVGLIGIASIFMIGGYVNILELGFQVSISKYVAQFKAQNDYLRIQKIILSSLVLFLFIGLIAMFSGNIFVNLLVTKVLKIPHFFHASFRKVLLIIFSSYLFLFPNFVLEGFFEGMQRFDILKLTRTIVTILYAVGVIILLYGSFGYVYIVFWKIITLFFQFIFYFYMVTKNTRLNFFKIKNFSLVMLKKLFSMSKFLFCGKISSLIFYNTPRIIIGIFLGPISMTFYEAVIRIVRAIKSSLGFINSAILPAASELYVHKRDDIIKKLFLKTLKYQVIFTIPVILGIMILAPVLYEIWLGKDFSKLALFLRIALIWNIVTPIMTVGSSILIGMKRRLKELVLLNIFTTTANIIISVILVRNLGLTGVFLGLAISTTIASIFYLKIYSKEFGIKILTIMKNFIKIFLISIIPLAAVYSISFIPVSNIYLDLLFKGLLWVIIFWLFIYFSIFDDEDRGMFKDVRDKLFKT